MSVLILFLLLFSILMIASGLGRWLSFKEVIPVKPFNCWECQSFWFSLIIGAVVAGCGYRFFDWSSVLAWCFGIASIAVGFLNYILITKVINQINE